MELLRRAQAGDQRAVSRAITLIEQAGEPARELVAACYAEGGRALVVGVTGGAGVGKSTLVAALTRVWRRLERRVAVVAVDPSSPFSGGAFLGDRFRMREHFSDPGVFIRSMATRGQLGGLAAATAAVVDLLDAVGYQVIVVETVGAGQEDVDIAQLAATTLLVLTPEGGDEVQAFKAGVMEVGDVYVVNKAELPGVERTEAALRGHLELSEQTPRRPIQRVSALRGEGVEELVDVIDELQDRLSSEERRRRSLAQARLRLEAALRGTMRLRLERLLGRSRTLEQLVEQVAERRLHPGQAAEQLMAQAGKAGQ